MTLAIYDSAGREIARLVDMEQPGGPYTRDWNGRDNSGIMAASGVYFYRLTAGKKTISRKMILLK